jgi:imidazolonepropionase-like amidohydrolase
MRLLVRAVRLIDGVAPTPQLGVDVLIDGSSIGAVEPHDPERSLGDLTVVDGAGRTLLPGLVDAHAHYTFDPTEGSLQVIGKRTDDEILSAARQNAERALRAGITTARGAGSIRNLECVLRDEIAAGRTRGPRIVAAGTAVGSMRGHGSAFGLEAAGEEGLAAATRQVIDAGAEDELRGVISVARATDRRVMAHAQDSESVRRCATAGVTSVEHAWLADEAAIEVVATSGAWLVPTLVVTDVNRTLPGLTPVQRERQDLIEIRHRASTEAAVRLGIPLATGTDTGEVGVTADMVWREIRLLYDHGATPMVAIQAATSSAARLLGVDREVGTVETGKWADLVLVDGDPLSDLSLLSHPVEVWQRGRPVLSA